LDPDVCRSDRPIVFSGERQGPRVYELSTASDADFNGLRHEMVGPNCRVSASDLGVFDTPVEPHGHGRFSPSGVFRGRDEFEFQVRALNLVIFIGGPLCRSAVRTPCLARTSGWTCQFNVNDLTECRGRISPGTDLNRAPGTNRVVPNAEKARPFSNRGHLPPTRSVRQQGTVGRDITHSGIPSDDRRTP
jgi:hypothetical protein